MTKGFWSQLFWPSPGIGARLERQGASEVKAPRRPLRLSSAFRILLSPAGVIALEGTAIANDVKKRLVPHLVPPGLRIRPGTAYPVSEWFHVRASDAALVELEDLVNTSPDIEVCDHLYGYEDARLLMAWNDAFVGPILVSNVVPSDVVGAFAAALEARVT